MCLDGVCVCLHTVYSVCLLDIHYIHKNNNNSNDNNKTQLERSPTVSFILALDIMCVGHSWALESSSLCCLLGLLKTECNPLLPSETDPLSALSVSEGASSVSMCCHLVCKIPPSGSHSFFNKSIHWFSLQTWEPVESSRLTACDAAKPSSLSS